MIKQLAENIYFETDRALIHDVFPGFKKDYLCLHSLLRRYKPETILEIGTNTGAGVNVMATALPTARIYSLDLDYKTMRLASKQYPINDDGEDMVGTSIIFPYIQLRGNSLLFDYTSIYPIGAWYIDGEHDYVHVLHESACAFASEAKLIVWHDTDMPEVMQGIVDALTSKYDLYSITDTRISYALLL